MFKSIVNFQTLDYQSSEATSPQPQDVKVV
jgi:hypothetical protein